MDDVAPTHAMTRTLDCPISARLMLSSRGTEQESLAILDPAPHEDVLGIDWGNLSEWDFVVTSRGVTYPDRMDNLADIQFSESRMTFDDGSH
jgi:hypothetical protein